LATVRIGNPGVLPPPSAGWSRWHAWGATARWRAYWLLAAFLLPPLLALAIATQVPPRHHSEVLIRLDSPGAAPAEAALLRAEARAPEAAAMRLDILAEGRVLRLALAHPDPAAGCANWRRRRAARNSRSSAPSAAAWSSIAS
jgi:hypothetical protein